MEQWKPVLGFEGAYEISDCGRLRRIMTGPGTWPGRVLKSADNRGYRRHILCVDDIHHSRTAHRMVYEAFIGPIPPDLQINHKNGDKADNRLANLEAVTPSQNTLHGFRSLGRKAVLNPLPGSKNGRAKLKEEDIPIIVALRSSGLSQQAIADRFGVHQTGISRILRGAGWAHLNR